MVPPREVPESHEEKTVGKHGQVYAASGTVADVGAWEHFREWRPVMTAIEKAVLLERDRCARLADAEAAQFGTYRAVDGCDYPSVYAASALRIAAAIRGEKADVAGEIIMAGGR
jgi:hypothetical protein